MIGLGRVYRTRGERRKGRTWIGDGSGAVLPPVALEEGAAAALGDFSRGVEAISTQCCKAAHLLMR